LAVCLIGDDPASHIYVRKKEQLALEIGLKSIVSKLPADTSQEQAMDLLAELNTRQDVHGILLQLPLPTNLNPDSLLLQISPNKDVDGLHPFNLGMLSTEEAGHLLPCTPLGIIELLRYHQISLKSKKALVIGRSRLIGKPLAQMLLNEDMTVSIAHEHTPRKDLIELCQSSDLIVVAVGQTNFLQADWIREGAVIVDVGINRLANGSIAGDVEFAACLEKVAAITPVPGGVGPLTVAHLIKNTLKAFELQNFWRCSSIG